jgi:hypothetical protein
MISGIVSNCFTSTALHSSLYGSALWILVLSVMMGTTVYPLLAYAFARLEAKRLFPSPDCPNTEIIRGVGTATTTLTHLAKGNGKHT